MPTEIAIEVHDADGGRVITMPASELRTLLDAFGREPAQWAAHSPEDRVRRCLEQGLTEGSCSCRTFSAGRCSGRSRASPGMCCRLNSTACAAPLWTPSQTQGTAARAQEAREGKPPATDLTWEATRRGPSWRLA